jgi:ABC-type Na+ efflux pump permease subunit
MSERAFYCIAFAFTLAKRAAQNPALAMGVVVCFSYSLEGGLSCFCTEKEVASEALFPLHFPFVWVAFLLLWHFLKLRWGV